MVELEPTSNQPRINLPLASSGPVRNTVLHLPCGMVVDGGRA